VAEFVRLEVDGGIGVIRLDRPPLNAISRQVQEELVVMAAEAANRADVRSVVVYGGEKVLARAMEYAGQFAKGPSAAYAAAKRAIDGGLDTDVRTGLDLEADLFAALFATDDRRIGMTSFVENGPGKAEFTGR